MTLLRRHPRPALLAILVAVIATTGVVGPESVLPGVRAPTAPIAAAATDLGRPAWFGMRLLHDAVTFHAGSATTPAPVVHAAGGILVDLDSHAILWSQQDHARLAPASTTKILTALVALENFDASRPVTVTESALGQAPDETRMGVAAGETLTVQELLTGMLMVSGNDAATVLAVDTVGMERFVGAMNAQADALGMRDSHFTNPVGLPDPQLRTSAYDLAVLTAVAVTHFPLFADIVATRSTTLPATAGHPAFPMWSINLLLFTYPFAVGIKPGWTSEAGFCEVGMAVRGGHRLISVLLDAPYPVSQTRHLLDWGFVQEGLPTTLPTPTASAAPSPHG